MAINKKIRIKIAEKTKSDIAMKQNIENVLSGIEEGRQGKRIIEKIMKSV
jgi:predicted methyltransferase